MKEALTSYGGAFLIALATAAALAAPVLRMLLAMRSRQEVSRYAPEAHQKKQGTPTMGGIMVVLGALVALNVLPYGPTGPWTALWLMGFAFIGFADDFVVPRLMPGKRGLGWKQKLVLQVVLAALAVPLLDWQWGTGNVAACVFFVLFFSNAYNFSDGLDGLAGTLGLVLSAGFGALALMAGGLDVSMALCGALGGALVPFLILNAPPAKVFMGDVGSLPVGAGFGLIACRLFAPSGFEFGIDLQMAPAVVLLGLVMVAELVPVPLQILWVKLLGRKLFPMTPIHHAFEKKGWPETRVVFAFALTQIVCAVGAVTLAAWMCTP